jgi:hypothetical protein
MKRRRRVEQYLGASRRRSEDDLLGGERAGRPTIRRIADRNLVSAAASGSHVGDLAQLVHLS